MYVPLQVGSSTHDDLGYFQDDKGDSISDLNCYFSELTGFYWIWKNVKDIDFVGTCHYRRYLIDENENIFNEEQYKELLQEYDLITTYKVHLNNSYHYGFLANHNIVALDVTGEVIKELYPEYYDTFIELVNGPDTYFGNILVTKKALFDEYCKFLFDVFFEVQKRIDLETDEDDYHKRVFGFISEFLLLVWVTCKNLKVYECKVGMLGEKAETREIKETLAQYMKNKDIEGGKKYFMEQHKKRPDILMEASDITGELHLAMQILATADIQMKRLGKSILDEENDFKILIKHFAKINNDVTSKRDLEKYKENELSKIELEIAEHILSSKGFRD